MNILITGCAGFVGTNLALKLLENTNNLVIGVDNMLNGKADHVKKLSKHSNFRFIEIDCRDTLKLLEKNFPNIDQLFHLAANSDISAAITNPTIDFDLGIGTTHAMLEFARISKAKHFIFSSGSGVYGESPNEIFTEKSFVGQPTSTYGATKLASEALISAYSFMFDFKATVFRFSNLVGPHQTHGVIHDFMTRLKSEPKYLQVLGDGTQLKPYIHILDALNGVLLAISSQDALFEVFNISNSSATSVKDIAAMVVKELNLNNVSIQFQESDRGWKADIPKYMMSSEKLKKYGWELHYNSDAAVIQAIRDNTPTAN
jgi:UDP-glucose 4-epimerase